MIHEGVDLFKLWVMTLTNGCVNMEIIKNFSMNY